MAAKQNSAVPRLLSWLSSTQ